MCLEKKETAKYRVYGQYGVCDTTTMYIDPIISEIDQHEILLGFSKDYSFNFRMLTGMFEKNFTNN